MAYRERGLARALLRFWGVPSGLLALVFGGVWLLNGGRW